MFNMNSNLKKCFFVLVVFLAVIRIARPFTASAATIVVNTNNETSQPGDGLCSLNEAVNNANNPGTDPSNGDCAAADVGVTTTITFSAPMTISTTNAYVITKPMDIGGSAGGIGDCVTCKSSD